MRYARVLVALFVTTMLAAASAGLLSLAGGQPLLSEQTLGTHVIFPVGTVIHVVNFSALARFTVDPPGAQLVGAFYADHSMWIMAWTNGTPMPMCPIAVGYVGPPMNASYNESLKPETYTLSEVCGGLGNLTVTQTIELVYANGGGAMIRTASGPSLASTSRGPLLVPIAAASVFLVAGIGLVLRRRPPISPSRSTTR